MDLAKYTDKQLIDLINNRYNSSDTIWEIVKRVYKDNTILYDMDFHNKDRTPDYIRKISGRQPRVRSNRIFTNVEAVINSLIANAPQPNLIPARNTPESIELANLQEQYFINKYNELNVKETIRKGLRNLYFGRLIVIKPFWNSKTNDFDCIAIDPRLVRFSKTSTKEVESEFAIEEITDTLEAVMLRFPKKAGDLMRKSGLAEDQVLLQNPQITYRECWIKDRLIFQYQDIILGNVRNPYWDWDGLLVTPQEEESLNALGDSTSRKAMLNNIRADQENRQMQMQQQQQASMAPTQEQAQGEATPQEPLADPAQNGGGVLPISPNQTENQTYNAFRFNHFDVPRKPYIFATVLNNENTPVGRTDFISQAAPLQEAVDRRKRQLDENAEMMNGWLKVDSEVMSKDDAQKLRYDVTGVVWGKGVATGVARETGVGLPQFIFEDMQDSRNEIDNIMAASSAFRGEREGQETKAGRLALIEQSALRLNELVQVVDYVNAELFNWFYQLAKVRYTEIHYAKSMGEDSAVKIIELQQDDFQDGTEVRVIPGKTLPEDKQFKYERAQEDIQKGIISPIDYFKESGYQNPVDLAKNAELYKLNPVKAVGITDEELAQFAPNPPAPEPPSRSISYKDLPIDGQMQLAEQAGIKLDPQIIMQMQVAQQMEKVNAEEAKRQVEAKTPIKD
jgi:hypothetical protein